MKTVVFNDELKIGDPEGFHIMDEEEMKEMGVLDNGPVLCLKDSERHIIISVGLKKVGGFASFVLNQKDIAKKMEGYIGKAQEKYGYRFCDFITRNVGDHPADGFCYNYKAEGIDMYAEALTWKKSKKIFYFYLYAREELRNKSIQTWEEILASVSECLD